MSLIQIRNAGGEWNTVAESPAEMRVIDDVPPPVMYSQDFESGVRPEGWEAYGPVRPDSYRYQPAIVGNYSLAVERNSPSLSNGEFYNFGGPKDITLVRFKFLTTRAVTQSSELLDCYYAPPNTPPHGDEGMPNIQLVPSGQLTLMWHGPEPNRSTPAAIPYGKAINIWLRRKLNANSVFASVAFSEDDIEPVVGDVRYVEHTATQSPIVPITSLLFGGIIGDTTLVYDNLQISEA